jgi:hypothetical protein
MVKKPKIQKMAWFNLSVLFGVLFTVILAWIVHMFLQILPLFKIPGPTCPLYSIGFLPTVINSQPIIPYLNWMIEHGNTNFISIYHQPATLLLLLLLRFRFSFFLFLFSPQGTLYV